MASAFVLVQSVSLFMHCHRDRRVQICDQQSMIGISYHLYQEEDLYVKLYWEYYLHADVLSGQQVDVLKEWSVRFKKLSRW